MRIGVAATAPIGADVLERLAPTHEIAFLLTRPDAPPRSWPQARRAAGQGDGASRLGIAVHQPEKPELLQRSRDRRLRLRPLHPARLLDRSLWLNVHPSLLPRWRGAAPVERAILAGDARDRRDDPPDGRGAGCRARSRRRSRSPIDELDAGAVFARLAEIAARLLERRLPTPRSSRRPAAGATYAEKIAPADRELDLGDPLDAWRRVRALSPHIGAWATLHGRRVTIWTRAPRGRHVRPRGRAAGGRSRMRYDEFLRGLR